MTTEALPGTKFEFVEHRLDGRLVVAPDGRTGVLATVVVVRDRQSGRVLSRTAHVRPDDGSGREWTTDQPQSLRPARPITPDTHPRAPGEQQAGWRGSSGLSPSAATSPGLKHQSFPPRPGAGRRALGPQHHRKSFSCPSGRGVTSGSPTRRLLCVRQGTWRSRRRPVCWT